MSEPVPSAKTTPWDTQVPAYPYMSSGEQELHFQVTVWPTVTVWLDGAKSLFSTMMSGSGATVCVVSLTTCVVSWTTGVAGAVASPPQPARDAKASKPTSSRLRMADTWAKGCSIVVVQANENLFRRPIQTLASEFQQAHAAVRPSKPTSTYRPALLHLRRHPPD